MHRLLLLSCAFHGSKAFAQTSTDQIHKLALADARQARPVHLAGVVTGLSGWKNSFFLQDEFSGISVNRVPGLGPELRPGDRVVVDGFTDAGLFAPLVKDATVTLLRHGKLPAAHLTDSSELSWGNADSQRIAVSGVVHSAERRTIWGRHVVVLSLDIGGGDPITVQVVNPDLPPTHSDADWKALVGAMIRVEGVCGTIWNDKRQFAGIRLFVDSLDDIVVKQAFNVDLLKAPPRQIGELLQYGRMAKGEGQVKIAGVVSALEPGAGFFLQDDTDAVFVRNKIDPVGLGDRLEVIGYTSIENIAPVLKAIQMRRVGKGTILPQILSDADAVIGTKDGFPSAPYNSLLVALTAQVLDVLTGPQQTTLLLKSGNTAFRAILPRDVVEVPPTQGSTVRVQGVCDVGVDDNKNPESFVLRLRAPSDVVVVKRAPWWTVRRALWMICLLALIALTMLGWIAFQRRQASLRSLVWTDSLTGLYNRRAFLLLAEKQIAIARRKRSSISLFYIDLDHFKEINDSRGHAAGDMALRDFSMILRQVFRDSDVLCRLGGDEFAILASDTTEEANHVLQLRLDAATFDDNQRNSRGFPIFFSMGSLFCKGMMLDQSIDRLLERTDERMYSHKRSSRQYA